MRDHLSTVTVVARKPLYTVFGLMTAAVAYLFLAVFMNYQLIWSALRDGNIELATGLSWTMATGYHVSTTTSVFLLTILIAAGIGVNMMLAVYRVVELSVVGAGEAGSLAGVGIATLAPACATCATGVLAMAGGTSLFALLPFGGVAVHLVSVVLLAGSALWISAQINKKHCAV